MGARRRLLRWGSWFALVNAGVLALVGLRYLWYYAAVGPSVAWIYALAAFVGQMAVFAFVPFLLLLPVILLLPWPRLIVPLGVGLGSIVLSFLVLDSLLFADNRYHLSVLTFILLAPQTWAFLALYFVMALAIEAILALWVWRRTMEAPARISRRTSHNDLAPPLVTELFGCTNPPADYASGQSLFSDSQWEWLITLSHNDFALLEPDQVTIVYPSGNEVRDQSYRLVQHPRISRDKLRAAMQEMSRFFN